MRYWYDQDYTLFTKPNVIGYFLVDILLRYSFQQKRHDDLKLEKQRKRDEERNKRMADRDRGDGRRGDCDRKSNRSRYCE